MVLIVNWFVLASIALSILFNDNFNTQKGYLDYRLLSYPIISLLLLKIRSCLIQFFTIRNPGRGCIISEQSAPAKIGGIMKISKFLLENGLKPPQYFTC